jgi:hypothetical protein
MDRSQFFLTTMYISPVRIRRLKPQLLVPHSRRPSTHGLELDLASSVLPRVTFCLLSVAARVVCYLCAEGVEEDCEGGTAANYYCWEDVSFSLHLTVSG